MPDARALLSRAVLAGLSGPTKTLPSWLFYDERGSRLYERITHLPEYYLARAELAIFRDHGDDIAAWVTAPAPGPLTVLELGAGTARKTRLLLAAMARRERALRYVPADISPGALAIARARVERATRSVPVAPFVGRHEDALASAARHGTRLVVLFVGSSIGNYEDDEAHALLARIAAAIGPSGALLLGTDLRKAPARLVRAYDDARGVTAAFNLNLLARLNRELGATFDLRRFRHVALWNEGRSRIEMHLESRAAQRVRIAALGLEVSLAAGERIHTESSAKYDDHRVDSLLGPAGLARRAAWLDPRRRCAVYLARAVR